MKMTNSYSSFNSEHGETAELQAVGRIDRTTVIIETTGRVISSAFWAGAIAYIFGSRSKAVEVSCGAEDAQ